MVLNSSISIGGNHRKDILGRQKKKLRPRQSGKNKNDKIAHFRDINIGDYVVHVNHGIGKYLGVKH